MISNFLLIILYGAIKVFTAPLQLLPDYTLPDDVASSLSTAGNYLANLDLIVPISTLLSVLAAFLAVEAGLFTYKGIKWVYNKVPGVN